MSFYQMKVLPAFVVVVVVFVFVDELAAIAVNSKSGNGLLEKAFPGSHPTNRPSTFVPDPQMAVLDKPPSMFKRSGRGSNHDRRHLSRIFL